MNDEVNNFKIVTQLVLFISTIYYIYLLFSKLLEKPKNRKKCLYYPLPVNKERLISILKIKPTKSQQLSIILLLLSILSIFTIIALEFL